MIRNNKKILIFAKETEINSNRIIGNDIDILIHEAMKYIIRLKDFYEREIKQELQTKGYSVVSNHSCCFNKGIFIYFDPDSKIDTKDIYNLSGREFSKKYKY